MRQKFSEIREGQRFILSSAYADNKVYRKVTKTTYAIDDGNMYNAILYYISEDSYVRVCQ